VQGDGPGFRGRHLDIPNNGLHDAGIRTTLTLDDDVARKLQEAARRRRTSFKQIVNETLRAGLASGRRPREKERRFHVEAAHCGLSPGVDYGKLNQLLDELDAADYVAEESGQ
jgi:hypothetical protein